MLGGELTYEIRLLLPAARLIVLESPDSKHDLARWIEAGAVDYLTHDSSPSELLKCIREAAHAAPRCSISRHTRVIGPTGQTICTAVYSKDDTVAAEPVAVRDLDMVLPQYSALMYKATDGPIGQKVARSYDSSTIPIQ
jgi:DNA-binding NarL/FixJ family response regulator